MKRFLMVVIALAVSGLAAFLIKTKGAGSVFTAVRDSFRTG